MVLDEENGLPVSVTIAVLRYRMWDIDIIINGALVYGLPTELLGATYFGGDAVASLAQTRELRRYVQIASDISSVLLGVCWDIDVSPAAGARATAGPGAA